MHAHGPEQQEAPWPTRPTAAGGRVHRRLLAVVGLLVVATLAGLVALWPSQEGLPQATTPGTLVRAEVVEVRHLDAGPDPVTGVEVALLEIVVEQLEGPEAGQERSLPPVAAEGTPRPRVGSQVELEAVTMDGEREYYLRDVRRLPTLSLLIGLFVVAVLLVGRLHGLRSLLGLGLSLVIVVRFVVPAILVGTSPPLVALVGAMAIMLLTLYLTHGFNEMTTSAVIGTASALVLTIGLALFFIDRSLLTGYSSEEAIVARMAVEGLDLRGLVLAGLIIATLGVLDDVTVSQASTVFALHRTDRTLGWFPLFRRAMQVGRDHIASVVNTLFLAYAGASLALLVLFSTGGLPVTGIINSEVLAEEIVKTVVGSLGLIAAVPLTTALATTVALQGAGRAPAE